MHHFGREYRKAIEFSVGGTPINDDVFALQVVKLAQSLPECVVARRVSRKGYTPYVPNPRDFLRLLSLSGKAKR